MKEKLSQLLEIAEIILFEPFRFQEFAAANKQTVVFAGEMITAVAAFSIATGAVYMTPPYSRSWFVAVTVMSALIYFFLRLLPFFLGMVLDWSVREKKERKENVRLAITGARILLITFVFFTPLATILVQTGLSGGRMYYLLLLALIALYVYLLSSLFSIVYELEFKSSLAIALKSLGILLVFPLLFNLVFIHSLAKLFE